jgi:transmembrane sensor
MDNQKISELTGKWVDGSISHEELLQLEAWYAAYDDQPWQQGADAQAPDSGKRIWSAITAAAPDLHVSGKTAAKWPYLAVAASILVVLAISLLWAVRSEKAVSYYANDVAPGASKATLILSGGQRIVISDSSSGKLAVDAGVEVRKAANGQLVYEITATAMEAPSKKTAMHTLLTGRGEQFAVLLPDGTKIWMNAESSLKFAANFNGLPLRSVELTGEAYFEVAHNEQQPFEVTARGQVVRDIGTEFNISAYAEESAVKTALVTGAAAIRLQGEQTLNHLAPGELASGRLSGK